VQSDAEKMILDEMSLIVARDNHKYPHKGRRASAKPDKKPYEITIEEWAAAKELIDANVEGEHESELEELEAKQG